MSQAEQLRTITESTSGPRQQFSEWMRDLRVGEPRPLGSLEVTPLIAAVDEARPWLLLHEAAARGLIELKEVSGGGTVNEVQVFNKGTMPVLILEGESIVGAKQNRVVVETVLVAPQTLVSIAVGCVEQGRWHDRTVRFDVGEMHVSPKLRSDTVREAAATGRVNQRRLWHQVANCMAAENVSSPTMDYVKIIEARKEEREEQARALEAVEGQVGIVAVTDGALVGLELVGYPDAWRGLGTRLLSSYLMWRTPAREINQSARGEQPTIVPAGPRNGREWLEAIAAGSVRLRPARGLAVAIALEGERFAGAGLWHEGRPAHLAVFGAGS